MSQFVVDGSSLQSLRSELSLLHTRLLAMPSLVDGFEGLLGGDNMDQTVEDFCTSWHHGVSQVGGEIADLMGGLEKAAEAYQRIDDRVRRRATSGFWGGPRPITGGAGGRITGRPGAPEDRIRDEPPRAGRPVTEPGPSPSGGAPVSGPEPRAPQPRHDRHAHPAPATPAPITVDTPLLTSGQNAFVAKLAVLTGLSPRVVAAWVLAQDGKGTAGDDNWLNIEGVPGGRAGTASDPDGAAVRTAEYLEGRRGGANPGLRAILGTGGKSPEQQLTAIADSRPGDGPTLRGAYRRLAGLTVTVA
jgi:hypothetical protein